MSGLTYHPDPVGTVHHYGDYVTTVKRADGWIAHPAGEPDVWELGSTEGEALGKLFMRLWREEHPEGRES